MDRNIVYPGSIPLDTDLLSVNRNAMVALGYLAQAALGSGTVVDGLACTPTVPASMTVNVGPGSITLLGPVDSTSYGSLPADITEPLLKMGINRANTQFTLTAPSISGQSINYLIEAAFDESDSGPVVLPYYNAANPAQPYSGPNNSGTAQNTQRLQRVELQLKPGAPANAGLQQTPPADSGWAGLYVVTVNYGQTEISAGNIVPVATAPFLPFKLPQLSPGVSRIAVLSASGNWLAPSNASLVRVRLWGGGGAGGAGGGGSGGGGAGGGYSEGYYAVTPGQTVPVVVAAGGVPRGVNGGAGGTTSFGTAASASGGGAGGDGSATVGGIASTSPGIGAGLGLLLAGSGGQNGLFFSGGSFIGGMGGNAFGSGAAFGPAGNSGTSLPGLPGCFPGGGGSGGIAGGGGGQGAAGLAILEW
ncbi:MAG: hypothetical protein JO047_07150 [Alphaproteobacteria bacterium]|nr:hypothetical protein [Alphaproteobacteria bacterium]